MFINYCNIMGKFSRQLKIFMELRNFDQVELSKKSGVDQSLINKYLREDPKGQNPSLKNLVALAKALNCTLEELTGRPGINAAMLSRDFLPGLSTAALRKTIRYGQKNSN